MGRKYAVSTVSLVPHSLGKEGFKRSLDIEKKLRLGGIHALPMRGWSTDVELYKSHHEQVISFEGPCNSSTLMDLYLFGFNPKPVLEAMENSFGLDRFIDHKFGDRWCMVEICPEASTQIQNYLNYPSGVGLVWDTRYVREKEMPDWKFLLSELPPESIKMIRFQPKDENELAEFINYQKNELAKMLEDLALKVSGDCSVILEIKPTIKTMMSRDSLMRKLSIIYGIIRDIMM